MELKTFITKEPAESYVVSNGSVLTNETRVKGSYIISAKGFLMSRYLQKNSSSAPTPVTEWTTDIKLAIAQPTKSCKVDIRKFNLDAFIWNPWEETSPKKGWWVRLVKDESTRYRNSQLHETWQPVKSYGRASSGYTHLHAVGSREEMVFGTLQEASDFAIMLNRKIIEHLLAVNPEIHQRSERDRADTRSAPYGI